MQYLITQAQPCTKRIKWFAMSLTSESQSYKVDSFVSSKCENQFLN